MFDCEVRDLILIDNQFKTCDDDMSTRDRTATEILADEDSDAEPEEELNVNNSVQSVSMDDVCDALILLQSWALQNGDMNIMNMAMKISDHLRIKKCSAKHSKISDFFVRK